MGPFARPFRRIPAPLLLALASCNPGFLDAAPPVLRHVEVRQDAIVTPLPVAYAAIFDLQLSSDRCAIAHDLILSRLAAALSAVGSPVLIDSVDVAVGCLQSDYRRLDVYRLTNALAALRARLSPTLVRPVVFYFNNINLPLNDGLISDLAQLPSALALSESAPATFWAVIATSPPAGLAIDSWTPWTSFDDVHLLDGLEPSIGYLLPFTSVSWPPFPRPLFVGANTPLAFKVCHADARIVPRNFFLSPGTQYVHPGDLPQYSATLPAATAAPHATAGSDALKLDLEICTARCERWLDMASGELVRWTDIPDCLGGLP